jgi:putative copper export protein
MTAAPEDRPGGLRDALVGVLVTAAVAVILAYAYGVGVRDESAVAPQAAPTVGAEQPHSAAPSGGPARDEGGWPAGGVPPPAPAPMPTNGSTPLPTPAPTGASGTPSPTASSATPPAPSPSPTCDPAVVGDLPLVGPLLGPLVDPLVGGLLGADCPESTAMVRVSLAYAIPPEHGGPAAPGGAVRVVDATVRTVGYLALAVFLGGLLFVTALWPAGAADRRTRRVLGTACLCGAATAVAGVWVQAAYAGGAVGADHLTEVLGTPPGRALAARALLWLLAGVVLSALLQHLERSTRTTGWRVAALAVGLGLLRTTGMTGHAADAAGGWWSASLDAAHLAAVATWFGGLTVLLIGVLPRRRADELSTVVPGFSRFAQAAVIVLAATGVVLAVRLVGSWHALTHTGYGLLLLAKLAAIAAVLAVAWRSKTWVAHRLELAVVLRGDAATVRPFVVAVAAETLLLVAVLGAASLLVTAIPGR